VPPKDDNSPASRPRRPRGRSAPAAALALGLLIAPLAGCAATGTGATATGAPTTPGAPTAPGASTAGQGAAPAPAGEVPSGGGVPFGPGPQPRYTVQPQPAPGSCHARHVDGYPLPDPVCTPGALNPKVTPKTLRTTICRSGYTASIRPPSDVTRREKLANILSYGYTGSATTAEYDHLVSLELGGDPNDPRNLWVEPNDKRGATTPNNGKDGVESSAHAAVCNGKLTLAEAQAGIATNWVALGRRLGLDLPPLSTRP